MDSILVFDDFKHCFRELDTSNYNDDLDNEDYIYADEITIASLESCVSEEFLNENSKDREGSDLFDATVNVDPIVLAIKTNIDQYEVDVKVADNIFDADFIVSVVSEDKSFNLQIQALAFFEISGAVDETVRNNYLNISSPSILYPYLRAFITNLVIQSGMKPIIIPPINFGAKPKESNEVQ